jgi:hypothetical protein
MASNELTREQLNAIHDIGDIIAEMFQDAIAEAILHNTTGNIVRMKRLQRLLENQGYGKESDLLRTLTNSA